MKKIIMGCALMFISSVSYATAYECKAYKDGVQVGETMTVNASKKDVAEAKAYSRNNKAKLDFDYVTCTE
ncbi:MAG: hypothetical protein GQ569_05055 [Methylococcaceae bacterium]|nr:hypothetical protein [Methylococcaceae bacterium]